MKTIITLLFTCLTFFGFGQRFKSASSYVKFYSDAPMEDIEAINESASSLIDISNFNVAAVIPIKSFDFEKELMEKRTFWHWSVLMDT